MAQMGRPIIEDSIDQVGRTMIALDIPTRDALKAQAKKHNIPLYRYLRMIAESDSGTMIPLGYSLNAKEREIEKAGIEAFSALDMAEMGSNMHKAYELLIEKAVESGSVRALNRIADNLNDLTIKKELILAKKADREAMKSQKGLNWSTA